MPINVSGTTDTKCPYYIREALYSISCEGIIDGTDLMVRFATIEMRKEHQENFCYYYPNGCPVCLANDEKYENP